MATKSVERARSTAWNFPARFHSRHKTTKTIATIGAYSSQLDSSSGQGNRPCRPMKWSRKNLRHRLVHEEVAHRRQHAAQEEKEDRSGPKGSCRHAKA